MKTIILSFDDVPDERVNYPASIFGEVEAGGQMIDGLEGGLTDGPGHVHGVKESDHGRQDQVDVVVQRGAKVLHGRQHLVRNLTILC